MPGSTATRTARVLLTHSDASAAFLAADATPSMRAYRAKHLRQVPLTLTLALVARQRGAAHSSSSTRRRHTPAWMTS